MFDIERFIEEKLNPLYKAHYAVWVYWWPLWRGLFSGRSIQRKWHQFNMIREGQTILDYGCGTGWFAIVAARLVGTRGKVYALDCFPRQLEKVVTQVRKKGLTNIETILSDCKIDLPDESIDTVWMCDVFHEIKPKREVLDELHRILRKHGNLVVYDGMKEKVLDYTLDLFSLVKKNGKFLNFTKQ